MENHQHLGSGLYVDDAPDEATQPRAVRLGPNQWRAEVSGICAGAIVREWVGDVYADRAAAMDAACSLARKPQ